MKKPRFISLEDASKEINWNSNNFGVNAFIGVLIDLKILKSKEKPYKKYLENGWIEEIACESEECSGIYFLEPYVTRKGLKEIEKMILKEFKNPK